MRRLAVAVAIAAAAAAGAAAGAGRVPSRAQLAAMPLVGSDFGAIVRGFAVERRITGAQDDTKKAAETVDPADTGATIAATGRLDGWERGWSDPELRALEGVGWLEARSQVSLYRDAASAEAAVARLGTEFLRRRGRAIQAGVVLGAVATAPAPGLPGAREVLRTRFDLRGTHLYQTSVAFSQGTVVGEVSLVRGDPARVDGRVLALAGELRRRIGDVLAGREHVAA